LLATLAGSTPAALEPVRLLSVTAQGQAVVIEATDPVAYTVSRPDAVTLVVDLRNAVIADAISRVEPRGPVAALRLEQTKAADGLGVARVRIALSRALEYRVKSSRNSIRVELAAAAALRGGGESRCAGRAPVAAKTTVPAVAVTPWPHPGVEGSRRGGCLPAGPSVAPPVPVEPDRCRGAGRRATIERVRTSRQGARRGDDFRRRQAVAERRHRVARSAAAPDHRLSERRRRAPRHRPPATASTCARSASASTTTRRS
jgi:hypothetical protein